jgi:hypothetical protein
MKVIKQGNTSWSKRIGCRGCLAVLEVEEPDILYIVTPADAAKQQYEDDIEGTFYVKCPECELDLIIRNSDIPKAARERIKDK